MGSSHFQPFYRQKMLFLGKKTNTIPITLLVNRPRIGTIGNHQIQSSSFGCSFLWTGSDAFLKNYNILLSVYKDLSYGIWAITSLFQKSKPLLSDIHGSSDAAGSSFHICRIQYNPKLFRFSLYRYDNYDHYSSFYTVF